jgi:hypothetical protein
MRKFLYVSIMATEICVVSIFIMASHTAYANPILTTDKIWKITANGEKGDLKIKAPPAGPLTGNPGWITGTIHWTGRGGTSPYTAKIFGYWDDVAWKITFLQENKIVFDDPSRPEVSCNTAVGNPLKPVPIETLDICHGRDQLYTGYLFGGGGPNNDVITKPYTIAGSWEVFGGSSGAGGSAHRTIFGWCATYEVDLCAPLIGASYKGQALTTNTTNMSNDSMTAK